MHFDFNDLNVLSNKSHPKNVKNEVFHLKITYECLNDEC